MLPSTVERVPRHTAPHVNERIRRNTQQRLRQYALRGPMAIERRLMQLDREWDVERVLEANAATAALIGLTLGATTDRRWFVAPAFVAGFLLQHAIQGWCPPIPILRRLGFRTQSEIDEERYALKAMRGDFIEVHDHGNGERPDPERAFQAARI